MTTVFNPAAYVEVTCMSCLVKLAQGCPTNNHTGTHRNIVHAMVRAATNSSIPGPLGIPVCYLVWRGSTKMWTFYDSSVACWATEEQ